ncbi:hypothetical protein [Roseovarius nitratireducens]|uniref:hypothetical protein n=1 Tax=Roseovarius nitratireducens TaxID=2044597 RepID=UPI000CE16F08|nr:hypothetical protein [Roseovarius nitratireducens]
MLQQNDFAYGRAQQPVGYAFGVVCAAILTHEFTEDFTAASDVLELGFLPGGAQVIGATLIGEGLGVITADIGTMDGKAGENDATRALTTDLLFDAVSVNDAENAATVLNCLGIARAADHRGIGATLSGDVAAGAGKKITVVLQYIY